MSRTVYFRGTSGNTYYAKPLPIVASPWATDAIAGSETGTTGSFSFAALDDATSYEVFEQSGGSPADSDTAVASIDVATLDAPGVRSAVGLAAADLDTQLSGIPAAVEAQMVNEADATALLQAIADKIAGDLTAGDLTALAIVSAIKADATLATMISNIDATISSRSSHSAPDLSNLDVAVSTRSSHSAPSEPLDAAGVRSAVGLASANLDTQLAGQTDNLGYLLAVLAGAISNADTATNTFAITIDGVTYTVTNNSVGTNGDRAAPTLSKA